MATWYVNSGAAGGSSTGSITSNVLTLTAYGGAVNPAVGNALVGTGITGGTTITGITTPWNGSTGVYTTSATSNVASESITIGLTGTNWVNATLTIAAAVTLSSAGDDFNLLNTHAETATATKNILFKGTSASPNRIFSCDNTNAPAQSSDLLAGASIACTSSGSVTLNGTFFMYGVTLSAATGGIIFLFTATMCKLFNCALVLTGATGQITLNASSSSVSTYEWVNTTVSFANAASNITANAGLIWRDTASALLGAAVPTNLFAAPPAASTIILDGVDLSAAGSGKTIVQTLTVNSTFIFINCKFGASVTLVGSGSQRGVGNVNMVISDSSNTSYNQQLINYTGTLTTDIVDVRSGGASDGTTPIAWKVVSTANSNWWDPFVCFEIDRWFPAPGDTKTVGQSVTASVAIMSNATLTTAQIWPSVQYLGNSSYPISSEASGGTADPLASGSNWAIDSTSSWTTTGVSGPVQQTLSVSFTPQQVGWIRLKVKVAKASQTLRIDPLITVS